MAEEHKKLTQEDLMQRARERKESGSPGRSGEEILAKGTVEEMNATDALSSALAAVTGSNTTTVQTVKEIVSEQAKKLRETRFAILDTLAAIITFPEDEHFDRLKQLFPDIGEWTCRKGIEERDFDWFLMQAFIEVIDELMPHIEAVMRRYQDETGNNAISFGTFMGWDGQGESIENECLFDACLKRIKEEEENPGSKLLDVDLQLFSASLEGSAKAHTVKQPGTVIHPERFPFPLDKVNFSIWRELPEYKTGNTVPIKSEKDGSKEKLDILFRIVFDEISERASVVKSLSEEDRLVYIIIAGLYSGGNRCVTASQIYKQGHNGTPGSEDIKKIKESIEKMMYADLTLDNKQEANQYTGYSWFQYRGPLLPCEIVYERSRVDDSLTEVYIYPTKEAPLIRFARERNQLSYIPQDMLQLPISKTEGNLKLDTYLIWRIKRAKNNKKKKSEKILLSTLYSHCDITTKKQKQRAPEKYRKLLDHYKSCSLITGYKEDKDSITVKW